MHMEVNEKNQKVDVFSRHCKVQMLTVGSGTAKAQLVIGPEHLNAVGIVHGAAIFTLADAVFAAAANSHDHVAVAVNINISYLKAVSEGILTAQAVENNLKGRMGSYTITVQDEKQNLIAVFEGLAYRKLERKES